MHLVKDENGNPVPHNHGEHHHHHDHECGGDHQCGHHHHHHDHAHGECGECKSEGGCKNETVALLTYMVQHNEHHAAELDQMADNLVKLGMEDAAKTIKEGVADFQKANMRFSLALTQVKEHAKEA